MHTARQFSVFLVNKPGVLAQVTKSIAKSKANIQAMTLVDSSEHGVLRFVCDDPVKTREILGKSHDYWTETEVLVIHLRNEPGMLAAVADKLAAAHINIAYAYTSGGAPGGRTTCVFKVADLAKSMRLLKPYDSADKTRSSKRSTTIRRNPAKRAAKTTPK